MLLHSSLGSRVRLHLKEKKLDNDNKRPCNWFGYLLHHFFNFYFKVYFFYLLKKKLTVKQPQAGPSGRIPEEDVVIIGHDSSTCLIVPEDLPVGQAVEVEDSGGTDDPDPVWDQANMYISVLVFTKKSVTSKKTKRNRKKLIG